MTIAVPVVLFLFNRPATLAPVIDAILAARPAVVVAIADGPRANRPDDVSRCDAARALVERLDGRCAVVRHFSDTNLGCGPRIRSGLDWVFERHPEAIVIEDDILADPSFFPWAERMLERYRDRADVMHVSGRNQLGRWTGPGDGHALTRRGSAWGWATWRRAWQRAAQLPGDAAALARAPGAATVDPLVAEHYLMLQEVFVATGSLEWDCEWELKRALLGGLSVVPSVNLVAHIGFGADATRNHYAADIGGLTPVRSTAEMGEAVDRCVDDPRLDRWSMMLELMSTYREPAMVRRLARLARFPAQADWAHDRRLRQHLAPFRHADEALALLDHLCRSGARRESLAELNAALRAASPPAGERSASQGPG